MKKHHLINQSTGMTYCGINPLNQLIAFEYENDWFDSTVHPIDHTNYKEVLCINCMKQHDIQLIEKFEYDAFLIDYNNRLPKSGRAMKFFKSQSRLNRKANQSKKPSNTIQSKPSVPSKEKQSKPVQSNQSIKTFPKSSKGKARQEKKKANQSKATESKCVVIDKPKKSLIEKPKDDIIVLKDEVKPLIDLSKGSQTIIAIEEVPIDKDWRFGDPIENDVIELEVNDDWKIVRHDKKLNQWKFVNRITIKGLPKWSDDSEWINYKDACQLINDGYCD